MSALSRLTPEGRVQNLGPDGWFDVPPPAPLCARNASLVLRVAYPDGSTARIYVGPDGVPILLGGRVVTARCPLAVVLPAVGSA